VARTKSPKGVTTRFVPRKNSSLFPKSTLSFLRIGRFLAGVGFLPEKHSTVKELQPDGAFLTSEFGLKTTFFSRP
jgi:hypothetical protein